jgi:hypothetical protein
VKKAYTVEELVAMQSELLRDMFIANLALAGIPQLQIAKVVQVDLNRVNRIAKLVKNSKRPRTASDPNR